MVSIWLEITSSSQQRLPGNLKMLLLKAAWLLLALVHLVAAYDPPEFSFNSLKGAAEWAELFPRQCAEENQSPVEIQSLQATARPFSTSANFSTSEAASDVTYLVKNVGFQIDVDVSAAKLDFNGLGMTFSSVVDSFHFHWGELDATGSAHAIDGRKFAMEVHIVLLNSKYPRNELTLHPDGIIGLAVFFKVGRSNPELQSIVDVIPQVTLPGGNATIKAFPLENLLPKEGTRKFYRYRGSVDVPNCEEAVEWTVFETPLEVSAEQLAKFRKIMAFTPGSGQTFPMVNNYRPLQSLGDRVVYRSAANFCLPSFLGFLCCFFAFFWRFV